MLLIVFTIFITVINFCYCQLFSNTQEIPLNSSDIILQSWTITAVVVVVVVSLVKFWRPSIKYISTPHKHTQCISLLLLSSSPLLLLLLLWWVRHNSSWRKEELPQWSCWQSAKHFSLSFSLPPFSFQFHSIYWNHWQHKTVACNNQPSAKVHRVYWFDDSTALNG